MTPNIFKDKPKQTTLLSVQVPSELVQQLDTLAERAEMTRSAMTREALKFGLDDLQRLADEPELPIEQDRRIGRLAIDQFMVVRDNLRIGSAKLRRGETITVMGTVVYRILTDDNKPTGMEVISTSDAEAYNIPAGVVAGWLTALQPFTAPSVSVNPMSTEPPRDPATGQPLVSGVTRTGLTIGGNVIADLCEKEKVLTVAGTAKWLEKSRSRPGLTMWLDERVDQVVMDEEDTEKLKGFLLWEQPSQPEWEALEAAFKGSVSGKPSVTLTKQHIMVAPEPELEVML